jgi:hypothetical protein
VISFHTCVTICIKVSEYITRAEPNYNTDI